MALTSKLLPYKVIIPFVGEELKRIWNVVGDRLMKVDWIKLEVEAYQNLQKKKQHHKRWAKLMQSGGMVRDSETDKSNHKTLATVTDRGITVEYMDGE